MTMLQLPRPESFNAVTSNSHGNAPQSGQGRTGIGKPWIGLFTVLIKKFNASDAVVAVANPNATDLATAITLANETKAQLNALLTALKT
jgi:hypothetical protein